MKMNPVLIGIVVAIAVIVAFVVGMQMEDNADGPLEQLGETIDKKAQ